MSSNEEGDMASSDPGRRRTQTRALKITDLPMDVLRIVFNDFEDDAITDTGMALVPGPIRWDSVSGPAPKSGGRRMICGFRLVCRLFYDLASPLLFSVLDLHVSQSSLELAENISRNPRIASGVRAIRISLAYRPRELAEDLERFRDLRTNLLRELVDLSGSQYQKYRWHSTGEALTDPMAIAFRRVSESFERMEEAWRTYTDAVGRGQQDTVTETEDTEMLRQGHAEFRRLHEEQWRLLQNGTFADALGSAVGRMPNVHSLRFIDTWHPYLFNNGNVGDVLINPEKLSAFMSGPLRFMDLVSSKGPTPVEMESARLLSELPISLHRAGVTVTDLDITCFPSHTNFSKLCPESNRGARSAGVVKKEEEEEEEEKARTADPAWDDLALACANLESFIFDSGPGGDLAPHIDDLSPRDKAHADHFLGSILSRCGPKLRALSFYPRSLVVDTTLASGDNLSANTRYPAGPALARLAEMPRLQSALLYNLTLDGDELRALFGKLGPSSSSGGGGGTLKMLQISAIRVQDGGSWARAVDVLRGKVASSPCGLESWAFWLTQLDGGEFAVLHRRRPESARERERYDWLVTETREYVRGVREENPLRAVEGRM